MTVSLTREWERRPIQSFNIVSVRSFDCGMAIWESFSFEFEHDFSRNTCAKKRPFAGTSNRVPENVSQVFLAPTIGRLTPAGRCDRSGYHLATKGRGNPSTNRGAARIQAMGLVRASGRAIDNGQPSLRGRAELRSTTFSPYEAA